MTEMYSEKKNTVCLQRTQQEAWKKTVVLSVRGRKIEKNWLTGKE